ncbi:Double-strand break repair protein MRE11 [Pseudozyma hubeiensis]|nr:Double-strand break repair protein MRE11 [Pseudozyma hubeiensis]
MARLTRRTGTQKSAPSQSQQHSQEQDELVSSSSQHQGQDEPEQSQHTRGARASRRRTATHDNDDEAAAPDAEMAAAAETDRPADDDHDENAHQPPPSTFSAQSETDHIKIMLATDNHIGYMERDPVRGQDSIRTFEEILQLAVQHDVDLILLGGDLFHENKPSRATLHQTMALLRQYTLGDKPISVELLSDPNDGALPGKHFPAINYEDPNLNVGIPVFSIHGNHDDPQGVGETGALSALDLLSVSGLINYFGKVELPSDDAAAGASAARTARGGAFQEKGIRIKPVLLQKGQTKLALYGMGNIKDERMHFELRANRVRMYRPQEEPDSWFNILCVHQNRVAHNPKACVPETMFDDSIHLVVWGHEHEQMIQPQPVTEKGYHITQPGSSVATSLSQGETVEKCVAIIHVEKTDFLIEPIPLQTVRPFVMDDMVLSEELEEAGLSSERSDIIKLLRKRVDGLIVRAKQEFKERYPGREMPLPLIRLRVEYTNQEISNPQRFGQEFAGKVANPKEVLQFTKRKNLRSGRRDRDDSANGPSAYVDVEEEGLLPIERLEKVDVGKLVQEYLQAQNLDILNPEGLEGAVLNFVEKDDREAIDSFVTKMLKNTVKGLVTIDPEESRIDGELERIRQQQLEQRREMDLDMEEPGTARRSGAATRGNDSDDSMMDDLEPPRTAAPARSTGRGRNARAARQDDEEDEEDDFDDGASVASSTRRGTTRRAAATSSTSRAKKAPTARTPARASVSSSRGAAPAPTFLGPESAYAEQEEESDVAIDEHASTPAPPATRGHASVLDMLSRQSATSKSARGRSKATATASAAATARGAAPKQSAQRSRQRQQQESIQISDDDDGDAIVDGDDDDEFVEPTTSRTAGRRTVRR